MFPLPQIKSKNGSTKCCIGGKTHDLKLGRWWNQHCAIPYFQWKWSYKLNAWKMCCIRKKWSIILAGWHVPMGPDGWLEPAFLDRPTTTGPALLASTAPAAAPRMRKLPPTHRTMWRLQRGGGNRELHFLSNQSYLVVGFWAIAGASFSLRGGWILVDVLSCGRWHCDACCTE